MCLTVLFAFISISGAYADYPDLVGKWKGKADAIFPDGTVLVGLAVTTEVVSQTDGLFIGSLTVKIPGLGKVTYNGTGYVGEDNMIKGVTSFHGVGTGFIDATVTISNTGKMTITGTGRDLSDGSTMYVRMKKKD